MAYKKPSQPRGIKTEKLLLDALEQELRENGYQNATIDSIAARAGTSRAVFLKRFGSKEHALLLLFDLYCEDAIAAMRKFILEINESSKIDQVLMEASIRFEMLLRRHYASNRAMNEHFQKKLKVHSLTKKIFINCVAMMLEIKKSFGLPIMASDEGAWSAAQLLVTLNYNYVNGAMPGLPKHHDTRHKLISDILSLALRT